MLILKKKTFRGLLMALLVLLSWGANAQVAVNSVVADDQVQFANNTNFEIGTLTIKIKLPVGKNTATVTVTLPTGIQYVAGSAAKGANASSVALVAGSPVGTPVFTLVGTPNTEVVFTIKRKLTKAATAAIGGANLTDKVKAEVTGETDDEKDSNPYRVTPPVVTVQGVTAIASAQIGVNTTTFSIRNTGVGAARTIYFSIDYPVGVTTVTLTPPTGVTLAQVGTVPTGFLNAGKPLYSLTKPTGFAGNELVTITEVFKIAPSLCGAQPKLGYVPYWGLSATELFGENTKVDRNIQVRTYSPKIIQTSDTNKKYFEYGAGLCAATGQKFGTFYTAFKNNSTDATAYNNRIEKLWQVRTYFNLTNFCIIATDGTKIPIAETSNDGNATKFDFSTNAALRTTNAALTGKDIGFTDEDGDGYLDDLKPGAEIRICYDLVSKGIPFACNTLSIGPSYTYLYDNACGESIQSVEAQLTYVRAYTRINKSIFPAQLLLNTPEKGYLTPGMTSVYAEEQLQGQGNKVNNLRYHYYMQLPSGVGLKNVVFHYTPNDDFTDTTAPTISIGNIAAGGVLSWTTPDTPPAGVTPGKERLWGHISFELELTNCTGMGASAAFPYTISMMSRNQDGTTFCPIPVVCETATIAMGCSVPCTVKGPEMLSTKVERADNSYGWTDATMATRVQRANVSPEQRRKVLPLDTVEFFAEGKQSTAQGADNLFYYVAVKKNADLLPKSIKVKVGTHETTLQATDSGVITRSNDANANYYRWNLTDALPSGVLAAGQTFSVVATYQASNATENQDLAEQSGITSYFYTLANKNDTAINAQGVHTNALRCGVALIPVFDFGRTGKWNGMNGFILNGCYPNNIGGYYVHLGRNQASGSLLYEEYRPGILMKKIVLKMPLAYKITENPEYYYTANATQARINTSSSTTIPLANWVETTEGDKRVYTYHNPTNTADPYFLPPGMIAARTYNEWLKVMVQASCKSKEFTGTDAQKLAAARLADEVGYYEIEAEDLYYHYANESTRSSTNIANNSVFLLSAKPQLLMAAQGQGSTIRANKNEQSAVFALEARNNPAPNTWVSIPDITGVEVQGLEEVDNAAGTTVIRTLTPVTSISGEKMFFLNQIIQVGAANQKYYRLKFKLTNCSQPQIKFKVYAGWNCDGNPTQGYRATCDDTFLEYTVNIAQSKKEIEVGSNPTALPMCAKTPFSYIVKSTDEGDIFGANLVVTKQPGIVISDVKVEYPLDSGKVYNTTTLVDGKKIGVVTTTNKTTYRLSDILPNGSLPGSVSTNVEKNQKFKVIFDVQPDCDFVSGSSFDIDLEGNNLCGVPAIGPKVVAIVAGIQSATVNNYNMLLSSINYINGNANACDNGATYKVRVAVNSSVPSFAVGNDARLHIRFPQLYDIQSSDISVDRSVFPQSNPASNWPDPSVESRTTVGSDNEIIMVVPAGMKDTHYFEVTVKIKQKANTLVDCTTPQNIKVLTTDKITGIPCATLSPPVCPALIVSTSPERTAVIKNDRADLSITEVKATAVPSANKENLTIEYKIANAATASATYNGSVVVSLYNDLNNNGLVEASEVLATHTTTQALGAGVTSTVQTFTYLADQAQVCRLRLAIRNIDNKCLCDDKDVALPTPTLGGNLVSNLSTCETASVTFAYNAAAPAYDAYTWSPASYLSAANTPTPTFTYSGAKLTAPLTVTYTLTVKRTNGCESTQTVTVVVTPTTVTPDPNAVNLCAGNTIQSLKQYLGGLVSGTLRVYSTATATAELGNTIALTNNTTYYYSAQITGQCESARQAILVKIVATPTVSSSYTYCAGTKVAALWDQIDPADSDRSLKIYTVASGGTPLDRNTVLQNRTYYVADSATNGVVTPTCESMRVAVTVNITTVATPTVSATTVLCPTAGTQSVSFAAYATALSGNSLRWYATATATVPLAVTPTISTQVSSTTTRTVYVSQVTTAGCEGGRAAITLVVNDATAPTLSAPAPLVTDCRNAVASITTWLGTATATDSCGTVSLTNNYNAPADFCNVPNGTLTVTFVAKDLFGNTTTQTRTITLVSIKAQGDTFTVTHGAVATTTTKTVLDNDKVGTQTATTATVSMTVVTPATGAVGSATPTLNTNGTITVPAGTKSGTYQIGYRICTTVSAVTACDTATATIVVGAPEIKANNDTATVTNGITGGTVSSVLTNDSYNGVLNPNTNSVTLSWGTLPAGVVTTTNVGELKVNPGTASGTHQIPYTICDKVNNHNCSTATLTLVIGAPAVIANSDTRTVTNGVVGGTVSSVLTNDSYNGVLNPGTNSVTLSWGTLPAGVVTTTNVGELKVNAGTASGTHQIPYTICDKVNNHNCSTATLTLVIGAPAVVANNDTATVTNGITGGTVSNVLTNDSYNGVTNPSTNSVTLSWGTLPAGVITTTTVGELKVNPGTASGTHQIPYTICDKVNTHNCSTATLTLVIGAPAVVANNDTATVTNGITGGTVSNVLTNDSYNGVLNPNTNSVTLSWGTLPAGVVTTTNVGELKVNAGTASGTHQIPYTICDKVNTHNCSTATLTLVIGAPAVVANNDTATVTNGITGGTISNVLTNDSYNGVLNPNTNSVTLSWGTLPAGVVTTTTVGELKVNPGTASGTHQIPYTICDKVNTHNCSTATLTLVIGAPAVVANNDTATVTNGITGGTVSNVLTNDSYNGVLNPNTNSVTLSWGALPAGVVTTTTVGELKVNPGTASGTHQIPYTICDKVNTHNCSTATLTLVIGAPAVVANNDTATVTNGITGGTVNNVLTNDSYNGVLNPNTNSVTLSWGTLPAGVVTTTNVGELKVNPGTASGTHQIPYTICDKVNNHNCSTATLTLVIGAPAVVANSDTRTVTNGVVGGTVSSVLTNDSYNGVLNPNTNSVTLSWGTLPAGVVTTTNVGELKVNPGTASGTHQIPYTICDKVNTHNCSTATLTLVIGAPAVTPTITAGGDSYTVTGTITTPTTVGNILTNDSLGGQTPTVASVTIHTATPTSATTPRIDPSTGNVVIPSGTPSGTYTMSYYLCERANSSNCSTPTTVTVNVIGVVTPTVTPTITAGGDSYTVTGTITTPTTVGNILTNDSLGGQAPTVVSVTIHTATPTSATTPRIDPSTGNVIIPAGTPSGTYTMSYYLCERANSSNCSTPTTVTVTVVGVSTPTATPTTIEANGDTFVQNGVPTSTTTLGNILTNDKLNGNLNPAVQSVTITTPSMPAHTPYIHPGTGEVIVPPHTPVGVYELPYTICALASPTVCDTATAVVTVNSIEAHNDGRHLLGTTVGGTISSVLANDKLNGRTPAASEVTINWQAAPAGFTYNADGSITVAAGTAVGTYTISYTLCATATPTLCSEPAEVIVEVTAATPVPPLSITAVYDGVYYIEKGTATALTSVLANDLLDSDPATTGNVSLTWDISAPAGFTLNADGTAHVATDTAVGRYEIPYTICAKNGTLCSTTKLVVTVLAPTVTPTIEVNGETFTYTGSPTVGNVLTNEKLNGTPNPSVRSVTISIMPPPPGAYEPYLDPSTGDIIVPPHTPAGNYTITYRVCTIDTPVACGVASVVVVIPPAPTPTPTVVPIAADDRVETVRNTPVTINVLANDTPNGATPTVVTAPLNGTAVVNPDGTIEYTPNTGFVGTDRLVYTLCNASGCATATVNIEVTNKLIVYNGVSVNGSDKNNHFHIAGIEAYPDNTVRIYNRWGVKVWEVQSYDNVRNVFKGISNGRVTVEAADKLPQGTYYYIIEYVDENNQKQTMVGWLYLKKD